MCGRQIDAAPATFLPETSPSAVRLSRDERDKMIMSADSPRARRDGIESTAPPDEEP